MPLLAVLQRLLEWVGRFMISVGVRDMNYEWQLGPLSVTLAKDGLTNVVYNVYWRLVGTDGDYSASAYGSVGIAAPESGDFTPYEELTQAQVQQWVIDALGAEQVALYEQSLADQVSRQKAPVDANLPAPWA
jgi:hypothetical protein